MKVKHLLLTLTVLAATYVIYLNFQTQPDITTWKLFGWSCGINFSSHPYEKLTLVGLFALYIISLGLSEKETNNENMS